MKCSLCGYTFNAGMAEAGCKGCAFMKNCTLIRCPNCSFEMAPEPELMKKVRNWRKKNEIK